MLTTIVADAASVGLSVAKDRMVFSLDEVSGNIWSAKLPFGPGAISGAAQGVNGFTR